METCRLVVKVFSSDLEGRINFREFKDLICSIKFWQSAFKTHTKEKTGILRADRLKDALAEVGFRVNSSILSSIIFKYIRKDGTLRFGDFVGAILSLTIAFGKKIISFTLTNKCSKNEITFRSFGKEGKPRWHYQAHSVRGKTNQSFLFFSDGVILRFSLQLIKIAIS